MNDVKEKIIKNKTPLIIGGVVGLFIGIYGTSHYYQSEYAKLSAFTNMFGLGDIATNGDDGIRLARKIKPDLILLDIIMPGMDGADVAALIREDDVLKDIPIVFLTAIVKEEEADSQAGFTRGYSLLAKTATVAELIECIKKNA